jgi:TonB family protein
MPRLFISYFLLVFFFFMGTTAAFAQTHSGSSTDTDLFIDVVREPMETVPLESLILYPEEARKHGIEGNVTLEVLIDTNGNVCKVNTLKNSDTIFEAEAIRAIKAERFTPAIGMSSKPIKVWLTRTINFKLKKD